MTSNFFLFFSKLTTTKKYDEKTFPARPINFGKYAMFCVIIASNQELSSGVKCLGFKEFKSSKAINKVDAYVLFRKWVIRASSILQAMILFFYSFCFFLLATLFVSLKRPAYIKFYF